MPAKMPTTRRAALRALGGPALAEQVRLAIDDPSWYLSTTQYPRFARFDDEDEPCHGSR